MRLLYCIALDPANRLSAAVATRTGVAGQPLACVSCSGLAGVVSEMPATALSADLETLRAYQSVIDALFDDHPLIPMRFGTVVQDAGSLAEHLAGHAEAYRKRLAELTGCVEVGIRLRYAKENPEPDLDSLAAAAAPGAQTRGSLSGTAFLAARKAHFASREQGDAVAGQLASGLQSALKGLYVQSKVEFQAAAFAGLLAESPCDSLVSVHFLVQRRALTRFLAVAGELREKQGQAFLLSGPWPPYNFAMASDDCSGTLLKPSGGPKSGA